MRGKIKTRKRRNLWKCLNCYKQNYSYILLFLGGRLSSAAAVLVSSPHNVQEGPVYWHFTSISMDVKRSIFLHFYSLWSVFAILFPSAIVSLLLPVPRHVLLGATYSYCCCCRSDPDTLVHISISQSTTFPSFPLPSYHLFTTIHSLCHSAIHPASHFPE